VWAIDIEGPEGQPVYPSGAGLATVKDDSTGCGGYGRAIVVDHGGGLTSLYAHLAEFSLDFSDGGVWVDPDTPIGTMGHTGRVSGCSYTHLHYEESTTGTYYDGAVDPGPLLACVDGERRTYPEAWGTASWSGLPGHQITAVSEGSDC
jgi:murein DD-endopeptidase MepM/ murein hydrolase activator NlpD